MNLFYAVFSSIGITYTVVVVLDFLNNLIDE